jgi:hypothetical protein
VDQAVPGRASGPDHRTAQACNGTPRGCCAESKCRHRPYSGRRPTLEPRQSVREALWNLGPLKSLPPPPGEAAAKGTLPGRHGETPAYCSSRPSRITREALRIPPRVAPGRGRFGHDPDRPASAGWHRQICGSRRGSDVSRVKTAAAVWSKRQREGSGTPGRQPAGSHRLESVTHGQHGSWPWSGRGRDVVPPEGSGGLRRVGSPAATRSPRPTLPPSGGSCADGPSFLHPIHQGDQAMIANRTRGSPMSLPDWTAVPPPWRAAAPAFLGKTVPPRRPVPALPPS